MRVYVGIVLFSILVLGWSVSKAAIPASLNYQAYLTESDGSAVDSELNVTFAIYAVDVGGVPLWAGKRLVAADNGLFSVQLGDPGNPFPTGLFSTPLFIGITIDGDDEMLPRHPLTSVGFAFEADNALSLQGQGPAVFDQSEHVVDAANPHSVTASQAGAATPADIANLQSQLDSAIASITILQSELASANSTIVVLQSDLGDETNARLAADALHDGAISAIEANTVLALDGALSLVGETALFSGVNVQVTNGIGFNMINGRGNLIVGYNFPDLALSCSIFGIYNQIACEDAGGTWSLSHTGGSHNVVIGDGHDYTGRGGLITGQNSSLFSDYSSITGGFNNTTTAQNSAIGGGINNHANAQFSSIGGGAWNVTNGLASSVSGGGGADQIDGNEAAGDYASVSGGLGNNADGIASSVSGGSNNDARGDSASVSGGQFNDADGPHASISGGQLNDAWGDFASISGGFGNFIWGFSTYGSISGGKDNEIQPTSYASVSGGLDNIAQGEYTHVSGGRANRAWGNFSVVVGGNTNISGDSTVSSDTASNRYSVVVGGQFNVTKGQYSVVSGGNARSVTGLHDWRAGTAFETQ